MNKTEQIQLLGYTVNYVNETGDIIDEYQLQEQLELGEKEGTLYWNGFIIPIGRWWVDNPWKEIAKTLYDKLVTADNMIIYDNDSPRHVRVRREISEALKSYETANKKKL